ncbi:hypothetical protein BOX15_Mlig022559g1, partial [Macrostomum lignano]
LKPIFYSGRECSEGSRRVRGEALSPLTDQSEAACPSLPVFTKTKQFLHPLAQGPRFSNYCTQQLRKMPAGYLLISALLLLPPSGCGAPVDHLTEGADGGSAAVPVTANSFHSVGRAFLLKFGYLNDCPPGGQGAATRPTPTGYPLETTAKANPLETTTKDNLSTTSASSAVPQNLADLPELLGVAKKTSPELKAPPALADRNTAADCQSASDSSDINAALIAFQTAYELPRTGLPDPPTLDAMNERRCGLADSTDALAREANRVPPSTSSRRHPRSVLHRQLPSADRFHRRTITWELAPFRESAQLPRELQRRLLAEAFRSWATVSPVYFREIPAPVEAADWSDRPPADISVSFERLQHGACRHAFDGPGNEVSHARAAGPIHIDADEDFRGTLQQQRRQSTGPSVDLRRVFIHEIGHTLGLLHSARPDSVMHPANLLRQGGPAPQIGAQERRLVQKNYGACSAKVNSVFDWIRTDPSAATRSSTPTSSPASSTGCSTIRQAGHAWAILGQSARAGRACRTVRTRR